MADPGIFCVAHAVWQRANVKAAAAFFREMLVREPDNLRVKALHEGLLDVLEPARRVSRMQGELASTATAARHERRARQRRSGTDRRRQDVGDLGELERRNGIDRRTGTERRKRG